MTKIFPHCTISVGLAPLADKCGARSARRLWRFLALFHVYACVVRACVRVCACRFECGCGCGSGRIMVPFPGH